MGSIKYVKFTPRPKITEELAEQLDADIRDDERSDQDAIDRTQEFRILHRNSVAPVGCEDETKEKTTIDFVFADFQELERLCDGLGVYMVLPTEEMLRKGEACFNKNWNRIDKAITPVLSPYLRKILAEDYARMLAGIYVYTATIPQMEEILKAITTVEAYTLDKYGLYAILLMGYSRVLTVYTRFRVIFHTVPEEGNTEQTERIKNLKGAFIGGKWNAMEAQAFVYIINCGKVNVGDFVGLDLRDSSKFLDNVSTLSDAGDYFSYYTVCKTCLNATPEELDAIKTPPLLGTAYSAVTIAEDALNTLENRLTYMGEFVEVVQSITDTKKREQAKNAIIRARTHEEREQAIQYARRLAQEEQAQEEPTLFDEPTQDGEPQQNTTTGELDTAQVEGEQTISTTTDTVDIVRLPETFGLLLSRDLYGGVGGKAKDILPINNFIRDYVEEKGIDKVISAGVVEKTVEGLNLLQRFERVRPINGLYTYHTNISKFAEICGYKDANEEQKQELLTALGVLNGLYLIIWTPRGREAVNVLRLRSIGLDRGIKGNLVLDISEEVMKGRPNLLSWDELQNVREMSKGQAEFHFRYQIYSKGNMLAAEMQRQVFGYDTMLLEATDGTGNEELHPEQVKNVKNYIRKHKAEDGRKLDKYFEKYAAKGYISYTKTQNKKGEWVYKWKRLKKYEEVPPQNLSPQGEKSGSTLDIKIQTKQG